MKSSHSNKQTIIITGGAGYIGSKLAGALLTRGYRILVIDDLSQGYRENVPTEAEFIQMNILSPSLFKVIGRESPVCIFHLAASKSVTESMTNPKQFYMTNILGSKNVINAAYTNRVARVIFTSTAGVYGNTVNGRLQQEFDTPHPSSPYAETKLETEKYLLNMNTKGMNNVIVRFANVYGPGGKASIESVVNIFIRSLLAGQNINVHGDGTQTRDYIFIDDLVVACIACITAPRQTDQPIYNISTGKPASVLDVLRIIAEFIKKTPTVSYIPNAFIGQQSSLLDPSKIKTILRWNTQISLETGIQKSIEYIAQSV